VSVEALKLSLPLSLPLLLLYIPALGKQANNPTTWIDGWMDGWMDAVMEWTSKRIYILLVITGCQNEGNSSSTVCERKLFDFIGSTFLVRISSDSPMVRRVKLSYTLTHSQPLLGGLLIVDTFVRHHQHGGKQAAV
jgi:hypothetical protein